MTIIVNTGIKDWPKVFNDAIGDNFPSECTSINTIAVPFVPSNRCPCVSVIVLVSDDSSFCRLSWCSLLAAFTIRDNGPACQPDLFLLALPGTAIIFNIPDKRGRFGGLWVIMLAAVRFSVLTYLYIGHRSCVFGQTLKWQTAVLWLDGD